jgi:hypothetical protein
MHTLRCLREHNCPWEGNQMREHAAQRGSLPVLRYIQQQGLLTTAADLTFALNAAGAHCKLKAVKWLREQGAQ